MRKPNAVKSGAARTATAVLNLKRRKRSRKIRLDSKAGCENNEALPDLRVGQGFSVFVPVMLLYHSASNGASSSIVVPVFGCLNFSCEACSLI